MSYASVSVSGFFSAQTRAEGAIYKTTRSVLAFLIRATNTTSEIDVILAVERHDATIVARDNKLIEAEKRIEAAKRLALLQTAV